MRPVDRMPKKRNESPSIGDRLLSPGEVARLLGIPLRTLYSWRSRGQGPRGYRIGRHVRYTLDDIERWLEDHRDAS